MEQQTNFTHQTQPQTSKPMKWHKFLVNFGIWLFVLNMLFNATRFLTGRIEGSVIDVLELYSKYPALKTVHTLMGIYCVAAILVAVFARQALAGYKSIGVMLLTVMYLMKVFLDPVYSLGICIVCSYPLRAFFNLSMAGIVAFPIAMIFINRDYYSKRAELFGK